MKICKLSCPITSIASMLTLCLRFFRPVNVFPIDKCIQKYQICRTYVSNVHAIDAIRWKKKSLPSLSFISLFLPVLQSLSSLFWFISLSSLYFLARLWRRRREKNCPVETNDSIQYFVLFLVEPRWEGTCRTIRVKFLIQVFQSVSLSSSDVSHPRACVCSDRTKAVNFSRK